MANRNKYGYRVIAVSDEVYYDLSALRAIWHAGSYSAVVAKLLQVFKLYTSEVAVNKLNKLIADVCEGRKGSVIPVGEILGKYNVDPAVEALLRKMRVVECNK